MHTIHLYAKNNNKKKMSLQQHVQWLYTELEKGKSRRFEQWQNF